MNRMQPTAPKLFQQAVLSFRAERLADAERCCRQALALDPRHHDSFNLLGEIASRCGQHDAALSLIGDAIRLKPSEPRYHYSLACVLIGVNRLEEAVVHLRKALRKKPDFVAAHNNLGAALIRLGQLEQAVASFRAALRVDRTYVSAYTNVGNAHRLLGDVPGAVASYREALRLAPDTPNIRTYLGSTLREIGLFAEAEAMCREAIRIDPGDYEAHYTLAYLLLLLGRLPEGWQAFEARRRIARLNPLQCPQPVWDGTPNTESRILVHAEEGFGDTLQFCRYAPLLAHRAQIVFAVPPALVRLMVSLPGVEQIVGLDGAVPAFDMHLPLLSAPHRLGTTLDNIPAAVPYLWADPNLAALWQLRLRALPGLRVGLVWAGNPSHHQDRYRSISAEKLSRLADVPGVSFVSLQKSRATESPSAAPPGMTLHDWTDELHDFADTAALIAGLDLVISVDTSVVHLAGALGKPVWLLNRLDPDWRWLLGRTDSPWYPSLRQFRQSHAGDWDSVIQALREALLQLAAQSSHDGASIQPAAGLPAESVETMLRHAVTEHTAGRPQRAEEICRHVLAAAPSHPDTTHHLGILRHQAGDSDEAISLIQRAIALRPDAVHYRNNLGNILRDLGRSEEASACYREALLLQQDLPDLHHNLAKALANLGQDFEAEASFRRALALHPDYVDAYNDLGNLLAKMDRADEAVEIFKTALSIKPDSPVVCNNLGLALARLDRSAEAADCFRTAVQQQPDYAKARFNLAKALIVLGQWHAATACYEDALRLTPDDAETHVCYGMMLLLTGQLRKAWPEMDWYSDLPKDSPLAMGAEFPRRTWNGEDIGDKTLLLYGDQGFGDVIQFCRYVPLCTTRAQVAFVVPPALYTLLSQIEGVTIYSDYSHLPDNYLHCPLTGLPGVFQTSLDTVLSHVPYLRADAAKLAAWRSRLAPLVGLRVGLVWAGNPKFGNDRHRSIPFEHLQGLLDVPGVTFVSLQKGERAQELRIFATRVHDWMDEVQDFSDTAALIEALDLVIGVDTAVIHLAGALGKPVWLLNRFDTDWRWLLDRDDSPWYPTLRQFRQPQAGDWDSVLSGVRVALYDLAARGRQEAGPTLQDEARRKAEIAKSSFTVDG